MDLHVAELVAMYHNFDYVRQGSFVLLLFRVVHDLKESSKEHKYSQKVLWMNKNHLLFILSCSRHFHRGLFFSKRKFYCFQIEICLKK